MIKESARWVFEDIWLSPGSMHWCLSTREQLMANMYMEGIPIRSIGKVFGLTSARIYGILRKVDRKLSHPIKLNCKEGGEYLRKRLESGSVGPKEIIVDKDSPLGKKLEERREKQRDKE